MILEKFEGLAPKQVLAVSMHPKCAIVSDLA
jgi:hypothetical protein